MVANGIPIVEPVLCRCRNALVGKHGFRRKVSKAADWPMADLVWIRNRLEIGDPDKGSQDFIDRALRAIENLSN
jgi:hypothetical protein